MDEFSSVEISLEQFVPVSPLATPRGHSSEGKTDDFLRHSQTFLPAKNVPKRGRDPRPVLPTRVQAQSESEPSDKRADGMKTALPLREVSANTSLEPQPAQKAAANKSSLYSGHVDGASDAKAVPTKERSFGRWTVDKRARKRVYIALSGKRLTGREAMLEFRRDGQVLSSSSRSARQDLAQLIGQFDALMQSNTPFDRASAASMSFWGIPLVTVERYERAGVKTLFDWQVDCLLVDDGKVLRGGNLVYTAPTSGGKTLVAEILMLRRLARGSGTVFFVVPFVALVEEKAESLRTIWQDMCVSVKVFHSEDGGEDLPGDTDVCVCTIEKANMLFNRLLEQRLENQMSMLIIDEMVNMYPSICPFDIDAAPHLRPTQRFPP